MRFIVSMVLRTALPMVLAAAGCGSSSPSGMTMPRPSACGGTVTTQGQIDSAAFSADYVRVEGVNGNAIVVYIADRTKAPELSLQLTRDGAGSFPTGAVQNSQAALYAPNRVGTAQLNVTSVVDPYDASGSPVVNADGGSLGSIEATFTATFTGATISGSFSSAVCDVIVNI